MEDADSNKLPRRWHLSIGVVIILVMVVGGAFHGLIAVYSASYLGHFILACILSGLLYAAMRAPPDGDPAFTLRVIIISSLIVIGVGQGVAINEYHNEFEGSTLEVIALHAERGAIYQTREFYRYGAWVNRVRSGPWVYLCWIVQALTLPIILGIGALTGAFRAHVRTHDDELAYSSALDYVREQNARAADTRFWKPYQHHIRGLRPWHLARDVFYSYGYFLKPLAIMFAVMIIWPDDHPSWGLAVFWASLFMLGAANASQTGSLAALRINITTAFEQFAMVFRVLAFLVLAFVFAFLFSLMPAGFLAMMDLIDDSDDFMMIYTTLLLVLVVVVLVRLWPMLVVHYLFEDVTTEGLDRDELSRRSLRHSFWFGAPGPSMNIAWKLTSLPGALIRATLPAVILPLVLIGVWSEIEVRTGGVVEWFMYGVLYLVLLPYIYTLLMDRALALRETWMEMPVEEGDVVMTRDGERIASPPERMGDHRLTDDEKEFLDSVPQALVEGGEAMAVFGDREQANAPPEPVPEEATALMERAIEEDKLGWCRNAIGQGIDPNAQSYMGRTWLQRVCARGRLAMTRYLVEDAGGDILARSAYGDQALHAAVRSGNRELIDYVLQQGADINAQGQFGKSPLSLAAEQDDVDLMQDLIGRGALLKAPREGGDSALFAAALSGSLAALDYCLDLAGDRRGELINSFFLLERSLARPDSLERLLEAGADPNLIGGDTNFSLLHRAASEAQLPVIELLLSYDADPNQEDAEGRKPIDWCIDWDRKQPAAFEACRARLQAAMRQG